MGDFVVFQMKQVKEVLKELETVSSMIEYAISENSSADSTLSGIDGLDEVSSAKDCVSQAESYLYDAQSAVDNIKQEIKKIGAL